MGEEMLLRDWPNKRGIVCVCVGGGLMESERTLPQVIKETGSDYTFRFARF